MFRTFLFAILLIAVLVQPAAADPGDVINSVPFPDGLPISLTVAPYDYIYAPQYFGTTCYIFDLDLNVIGFVPAPSENNWGIAYVDPPGPAVATLMWLDHVAGVVNVTDLGGILLDSFSFTSPFGGALASLTWDSVNNTIWSCDPSNALCIEFYLDGTPTGSVFLAPNGSIPWAITQVGSGGCFDLATDATIRRVLETGEQIVEVNPASPGDVFDVGWHATGSTGVEVDYIITGFQEIAEIDMSVASCDGSVDDLFIRGDADINGSVALADPIANLVALFQGGPSPCLASQDTNGNGVVDLQDPIYNLNFLFGDGAAPPAPFPACGSVAGGTSLPCDETSCL